ncbi:chemotaxis protein CheW [bacterium]|nr:chemotaxis protein CheW [bacterium]
MDDVRKSSTETLTNLENIQGKYLTFKLADEEYGLEILKVKEIIGMMAVTTLPRTPKYVKGVINLRGKVIPVIDLRLKFGLDEKVYDEKTCIIVVEIGESGVNAHMGIIVDAVSEVLNVTIDELEPTPRFGVALDTDYILGMAKGKGTVRTLLDINKVLTAEELSLLTEKI